MSVIDALTPDKGRFGESKRELDRLLMSEKLRQKPILLLGNKIDKPGAASQDEVGLQGATNPTAFCST